MHSSGMRTGRSLTVCWRLLPGGGVRGVLGPGGCLLREGWCAWSGGGLASQHALRQTPPLWTESQTPVKTLPWPNFVAAGNEEIIENLSCAHSRYSMPHAHHKFAEKTVKTIVISTQPIHHLRRCQYPTVYYCL